MPRAGRGTRNAERMTLERVRRDANSRFGADTFPQRARATVKRIGLPTGERIPSSAVFGAPSVRQLEPQPGRGAWLTRQATVHPTDRPTSAERAEKIRVQRLQRDPQREALRELRRDGRAIDRAERDILAKRRLIAEGRLFDQWIFSRILADAEREHAGDLQAYIKVVRQLNLREWASMQWEIDLLDEIRRGNLAIERAELDLNDRRAEYIARGWLSDPAHAERDKPRPVSQLPLWDTAPRTPLWDGPAEKAASAPRKVRSVATVERPDLVTGNKFLDHALNND